MKNILKKKGVIIGIAAVAGLMIAGTAVYAVTEHKNEEKEAVMGSEMAGKIAEYNSEVNAVSQQDDIMEDRDIDVDQTQEKAANMTINMTDIGVEKAKEIALKQVDGANASHVTKALNEYDDGRLEYDVEIVFNGYEYDFEIDGATGVILDSDVEHTLWD